MKAPKMTIPMDDDTEYALRFFAEGRGGDLESLTPSQVLSWAIYRQFHGNQFADRPSPLSAQHIEDSIKKFW